jgi:hypothetical protein
MVGGQLIPLLQVFEDTYECHYCFNQSLVFGFIFSFVF